MVERRIPNPMVGGSSPSSPATFPINAAQGLQLSRMSMGTSKNLRVRFFEVRKRNGNEINT